ncbi:hypothetical protein [Streptomyces marincola]|uniref:hypothetical protein n=1 Tax=Streptomyces marincola TaxID=2878388 RepID=UPI001CF33873|nr:hypothetical protein [Streptomyces marincola]UCM88231.1 hypothetical protein LC193_09830 [Streptomyces marincola]
MNPSALRRRADRPGPGADRCRYSTGADDRAWLAGVLAAVGVPYRVERPAELARATRDLAARDGAASARRP